MRRLKLTFGIKITLILILVIPIPLLIGNFLSYSLALQSLKKVIILNLDEITQVLSTQIEDFISSSIDNIATLTKNPILSSSKVSLEEKSRELDKIIKYYPRFQDITFVDEKGNTLLSTSFKFYGQWKTNAWFQEAKEKKEIVMSEIYAVVNPEEPILAFFAPVFDEKGDLSFLMAVQIDMKRFFRIFEFPIGERGYAFLINSRGDILAHPNRKLLFEKISSDYPLKEAFQKEKGRVEFNFQNTSLLGTFKNIQISQNGKIINPEWQLIVIQPKDEILGMLRFLKNQIYFTFFVSFLFAIILAFLLGQYVTQPLKMLTSATSRMVAGDFDAEIKTKRTDEFGELAQSFNRMVKEIKKSYLALEESKKVLEIKVQARTRELRELTEKQEKIIKTKTEELREKIKELEKSRTALLNILEDVEKERRVAEEERDKTLAIISNFADGLLVFDKENRVLLINPQAEKFFQVEKKEVIGKSASELFQFPNFKPVIEIIGEEIRHVFRKEAQIREDLILEVTTIPIMSEGETIGTLLILHDITREKIVERMKSEFVSISAHQLRTPLSAIKWTLKMILDGDLGEVTKEQKEFLDKIYQSNERMINLINDLLNVARIEEGRYIYQPVLANIVPICQSIIDSSQTEIERKKLKVVFKKSKELPKVKVDIEKISLAIQNLVENAIRYNKEGGEIEINIEKKDKEIQFTIKDTGIGIPKSEQSRVFSKFYRGSNVLRMETEGSGLGLFITKNIIEAHGGRIWFESEEGKGTTFYFTLPVAS